MTPQEIPIGRTESQELELKSDSALDSPGLLGRAVVGMLNSCRGGEIWVGVREEGGLAAGLQPIKDADYAVRRLRDYFADAIEPPPLHGEVEPEPVRVEDGSAVVRIRVQPRPARGPFALLKRGTRAFVIRVGDRLRAMTREELSERFGTAREASSRTASEDSGFLEVVGKLTQELDELRELRSSSPAREGLFWLCVRPLESVNLDLQAVLRDRYLTDPELSGNRVAGLNFAAASYYGRLEPEIVRKGGETKLVLGREDILLLSVSRRGELRFEAPLLTFYRPLPLRGFEEKAVLYPLALLEYPTSVLRLAATLYTRDDLWEPGPSAEFLVHLAMFGLKGWNLIPGSPDQIVQRRHALRTYPEDDFELDRPVVVSREELTPGGADRVALRILREVYEAFGLLEEDMPRELDRRTGRLMVSD